MSAEELEMVSASFYKTIGDGFIVPTGTFKILSRNIKTSISTMLLGPTGVGKTEMIANIAKSLKMPLTIFDMGTMSDPIMSLVGTHTISVEKGVTKSKFNKSRFSEVIQHPGIVLLDELSRASTSANNILFPCLDFRRSLAMEYCFDDTTPIAVHPQCVFIATANVGSQYTGTHKLDRALIDRFMLIEIDPLNSKATKAVLNHQYPKIDKTRLDYLVDTYFKINGLYESHTIGFNLSIRHLKMIASLVVDGFTIYDSFYAVCKGIGSKDGLKAIAEVLKIVKSSESVLPKAAATKAAEAEADF